MSDVEGQLLAVYEPVVIHDLLTDLYENRGLHPSQIIALNDRVSFWFGKHLILKIFDLCMSWFIWEYVYQCCEIEFIFAEYLYVLDLR